MQKDVISKDESFKKLKYLESVLNSIVSNTTSYGNAPSAKLVSSIYETDKSIDKGALDINYSLDFNSLWEQNDLLIPFQPNQFISKNDSQICAKSMSHDPFTPQIDGSILLDKSFELNAQFGLISNFLPGFTPNFNLHSVSDDDYESHLLEMSFLFYCGHNSKENLSSTIPLYRYNEDL